jgi:hypothetical protein
MCRKRPIAHGADHHEGQREPDAGEYRETRRDRLPAALH